MSSRRFIASVMQAAGIQPQFCTVGGYVDYVCRRYGITRADIYGRSHSRKYAHPRQEVMWLARQAGLSFPQIGKALGRDHTSVLHGIRAHEARLNGRVDQRKFNGGENARA